MEIILLHPNAPNRHCDTKNTFKISTVLGSALTCLSFIEARVSGYVECSELKRKHLEEKIYKRDL
jgi:hypothetical protein